MLHQRLREERLKRNISQGVFAESCGVSRMAQINYENGVRFPDSRYLTSICEKFNIDIQYIITGVYSSNIDGIKLSKDELNMLKNFRCLTKTSKKIAISVISSILIVEEED